MQENNNLVMVAFGVLRAASAARRKGHKVTAILEHPEDLDRAGVGVPASIWQLPVCSEIRALETSEIALQQCSNYGVDAYLGPLPGHCGAPITSRRRSIRKRFWRSSVMMQRKG